MNAPALFDAAELDDPIARGEARAAAELAAGIADLRAQVATAVEWKLVHHADGRRTHLSPERQLLAGMLAHLERNQRC